MTLLQWGQTFIPLQHCSHVTLCPQFVNNIHRSFVLQITHNRFFFNSLLITLRLAGSKTKGSNLAMNYFQVSCIMYRHTYRYTSGCRDRMVGGFTTTYALYDGGQFYWWRKPEYPEENHRPVTSHWQTWSNNVVSSTPRINGIRTHNFSGDMHWLHR
jgi:hypothetical protein